MTQNTSAAVMQQRHEAHDSLDDFPTPPWATRAVINQIVAWRMRSGPFLRGPQKASAWDPCANRGHMVRPLSECFGRVYASDMEDYSDDPCQALLPNGGRFRLNRKVDFLWPHSESFIKEAQGPDWIFMNPPFRLAEDFIHRALSIAREGVAVFVRSAFLKGSRRYFNLFEKTPPSVVAQFSERVILHKGVLRDPSKQYWDPAANNGAGGWKRPASATAYCWMLWIKHLDPQPLTWIPPCRPLLEEPGDYPQNPDERGARPEEEKSLL